MSTTWRRIAWLFVAITLAAAVFELVSLSIDQGHSKTPVTTVRR
jgi:hypothetical protein